MTKYNRLACGILGFIFALALVIFWPDAERINSEGIQKSAEGPAKLLPSSHFLMENEAFAEAFAQGNTNDDSFQIQVARHGFEIHVSAETVGSLQIKKEEEKEDAMFSKSYWDALLGIGDDRQGRANIPEMAVKEFGALKKVRHFHGNYISGYILTFKDNAIRGRLWTNLDNYYGDFAYTPVSSKIPESLEVVALLAEVDAQRIRLD